MSMANQGTAKTFEGAGAFMPQARSRAMARSGLQPVPIIEEFG
jgi:hypothetical protein